MTQSFQINRVSTCAGCTRQELIAVGMRYNRGQRWQGKDFYVEYKMLTFQVPFMFITDTKEMFLRRQKRLKQLKRQEMSQQQLNGMQEHQQQQPQQQQQNKQYEQQKVKNILMSNQQYQQQRQIRQNNNRQNFLRQLQLGLSQLMVDESSYLNIEQQQMDQCVYDIYTGKDVNHNNDQLVLTELSYIKQKQQPYHHHPSISFTDTISNVDHLICDFQQVDVQQAIQFYRQFIKTKNGSTLISQLLQEQIKLSHKNSQKNSQNISNQSNIMGNSQNVFKNDKNYRLGNYYANKQLLLLGDYTVGNDLALLGGNDKRIVSNNNNYQNATNRDNTFNKNSNKIPHIEINYASTPHPSPNNKPKPKPKSKPKKTQPNSTLIDKYLQKYKSTTTTTTNNQIENQQQQDYLIQQQQKQQRNKIRQKAQKLLLKIKTQSSTLQSF